MSVIILDEAVLHYEVLGRGRPVIFLHSWVGSWRYWMASMQVASATYRAYALDLYGYGETTHDPRSYSIEHQAGLVSGFLDQMGIGRVAIVGHGLGALVGLAFAATYPSSVERLMAVSSPLDLGSLDPRLMTAAPPELVGWLSDGTPESLAALADASKSDPLAAPTSINSFQFDGMFSTIRGSNLPCLFVYGGNDPCLRVPSADSTTPLGRNAYQVTLESSGHFPMLDEASRFNRLLTDFLALPSGSSPLQLQLKDEWKRRVR